MKNRMMDKNATHCYRCGVPNTPEINQGLWDVYERIRDGRSTYEPLVFDSEWLQENVVDEEDEDILMLTMERDMDARGLCPFCGRPNLHGVTPDMIMTDEEAKELHEMWAMEAAERRAGC